MSQTPSTPPKQPGWINRHQIHMLRFGMIGIFILMVLGGVYVSHQMLTLSQRASDNAKAVTLLSKNLDTSRKQLSDHGITPSAPPAKAVVQEVRGEPGATGAPGQPGAPGAPGIEGPPGPSGSPGKPGARGAPGQPGTGATGAPGADGTNGVDGQTGPPGPAGPAGQDGKDGTNGTNGKDGKDGQPPAGWTWTDPEGVTYTCVPVDGFDPAAPRYTCTQQQTPPPTSPPPTTSSAAYQGPGSSPSRPADIPVALSSAYAIVSERKRL